MAGVDLGTLAAMLGHSLPSALLSEPPAVAGGSFCLSANSERILKVLIRPSAEAIN
jgi:hypothetical protein